jgi:hypothetical protein
MTRGQTAVLIVGALLLSVGAGAYQTHRVRGRCTGPSAEDQLLKSLPVDKNHDGFVIANAHPSTWQIFASPVTCEADVTPIVGNVDMGGQPWRHVTYRVSTNDGRSSVSLL